MGQEGESIKNLVWNETRCRLCLFLRLNLYCWDKAFFIKISHFKLNKNGFASDSTKCENDIKIFLIIVCKIVKLRFVEKCTAYSRLTIF